MAGPYFSPEDAPPVEGVSVKVLASGLDHPWSMAWLPDGGLLITERLGRVRLWRDGHMSTIPGGPEVLVLGQGGLLDISLHPDFERNHFVYFTIATGNDSANRTTLVRAEFDGERFLIMKSSSGIRRTRRVGSISVRVWSGCRTVL